MSQLVHEVVIGEIELDFFAVEVLDQGGAQYLTENELVIDSVCSKVHVCPPGVRTIVAGLEVEQDPDDFGNRQSDRASWSEGRLHPHCRSDPSACCF